MDESRALRKIALEQATSNSGLKKVAFDTRRIDQETEYNPRRGLQYYNRSEPFVSEGMGNKIANFTKLRNILVDLKEAYGAVPEWQDSNARVLLATIDRGLRANINDGDFTENQPGIASLGYIDQLMYVRYRISSEDLNSMSDADLRKSILSKDEELTNKYGIINTNEDKKVTGNSTYIAPTKKADAVIVPKNVVRKVVEAPREITKTDVANQSYDSLVDKLFGNVKASEDAPEVLRTITISIKDSIVK